MVAEVTSLGEGNMPPCCTKNMFIEMTIEFKFIILEQNILYFNEVLDI